MFQSIDDVQLQTQDPLYEEMDTDRATPRAIHENRFKVKGRTPTRTSLATPLGGATLTQNNTSMHHMQS